MHDEAMTSMLPTRRPGAVRVPASWRGDPSGAVADLEDFGRRAAHTPSTSAVADLRRAAAGLRVASRASSTMPSSAPPVHRSSTPLGATPMRTLIVFALVGLGAQLVDGALGMAYGVTSTSLLLVAGVNPATASASVHLAELGTTLAAGASHWRFGNVDWKLVLRLGVPGAVGAFLGATVPVVGLHRRRRPVHGRRAAGAGRLHPAEVRAPPAEGGDRTGVAARVQALVPAGFRRGVRRRVRWRRVGPGGHAGAADRGQDRTADDHRLGRHVRVPRRAGGGAPALLVEAGEARSSTWRPVGGLLLGGVVGRAFRGLAGHQGSRLPCSAAPSAASSCSPTRGPSCRRFA